MVLSGVRNCENEAKDDHKWTVVIRLTALDMRVTASIDSNISAALTPAPWVYLRCVVDRELARPDKDPDAAVTYDY